jgi:hypothetical protein
MEKQISERPFINDAETITLIMIDEAVYAGVLERIPGGKLRRLREARPADFSDDLKKFVGLINLVPE